MGGKTQTSTSSVQIPPEVLARYNAVNARAEQVAATPFQQYSQNPNAFVAPMTATQNQAIGQIANASTMAQPYFQTGAAATMAGMGPANLGELDTQKYMSPYLQNVVQNTADILGQQNQQAMSGALGTAIGAGAGFGDRSGIAAANLARQQQMGLGSTIGNLLNQGYMQAQGVAQQQQGADLAARQANLARLLQGGGQFGQLGAGAQGAALAGGQALLGAGTQEQQTNQAGLSALYNQFLQERAYPFQVAQFLGNLAMGTGALSGSTTTTTSPAGFFSGFKKGGKVDGYRRGGLVPESMGGHVASEHMGEGYADGGMPMDYSTMVMQQLFGGTDPSAGAYGLNKMGLGAGSYIPKADLPVGQLMIADPVQAPTQTNASDIVDMASSLGDTAEKAGAMWDKYGPKASPFDVEDEDTIYGKVATGGAIRPGLSAGGMPYDPESTGYVPDNTPGKPPELLQPKAPDQPESGLGKVADIAKLAMMFMGMNRGGSTYADGGHVVERGDTLTGIARKYGRSLEDILSANPELRKNPDFIQIGQRVMLPQDRQAAGTPFPPKPSDFPARPGLAGSMPRADVALPANYEFPTAGFGQERYPGSYMSGNGQKNLMDLLKLEAMRRDGSYASGGVAGRSGYLDGGFASDAALAELARKKKQDILSELGSSEWTGLGAANPANGGNSVASDAAMAELARQRLVWQNRHQDRERSILDELRSSDWSGGLGAANPAAIQPASATPPAPQLTGLAAGKAALAATGNTAPSPLTYTGAPDNRSDFDVAMSRGESSRNYSSILEQIAKRSPSMGPLDIVGDRFLNKTDLANIDAQRKSYDAMREWYQGHRDQLMSDPRALAAAAADPFSYYKDRSGFEGGLIPASSGSVTSVLPSQPATTAGLVPAAGTPTAGYEPAASKVTADLPMPPLDLGTAAPAAGELTTALPKKPFSGSIDDLWSNVKMQESGNRQFRGDGSLIVGDNGKSIGISQIQDAAAREAAAYLGVEYDPARLRADEEYNEMLGKGYLSKMMAKYGNAELAAAAYNAGPGRVDDALAKAQATGRPWQEFIPESTVGYIANVTGGARAGTTGGVRTETGGLGGGDIAAGRSQVANAPMGGGVSGGFDLGKMLGDAANQAGGAENIILPFLSGLGKMAGSQSRFLGTALLEGIGGGAEAYMNRQKQLADISQTKATALNAVASALSNMLVNDGQGNLFVPLQGGGYEPIYSYINNPNRQPSILGPEIDKVLAEIGAGNVSAVGRLTQLAQQSVNGGIPAQPEAPGNIMWDASADADVANTKAMYGSNVNTASNLAASRDLLTGAETDASAAMRSRRMLRNDAKVLTEAIASGNTGSLNSYINNNILGPIASIMARMGQPMPEAADPVAQMQILEKSATILGSQATTAAELRAVEALNIMRGATPGVDLTKAANAEIMASMLQQNQDAIDRRAYYGYFQNRTGGLLQGAEASYNDHYAQIQAAEHGQLRKLFEMADKDPRISHLMDIAASGAPFSDVQGLLTLILGDGISPALARYLTGGT